MRRREFIKLLGGALAAWPLAARAQQGVWWRHMAMLLNAPSDDTEFQVWVGAFRQALQELGWTDGRNIRIDYRWGAGDADKRKYAAELVALAPDVIVAPGASTVGPLLQATRTVPIVFPITADPVAALPNRDLIIKLAALAQLAPVYFDRCFVAAGGLIS